MFLLTDNHIKNHFITNPDWKNVFLKHFPNWSSETYVQNALDVWLKNGWSIQIDKHGSKNPESKMYPIVYIGVYHHGNWEYEIMLNDCNWEQQILIKAICDYDIDFSTFK